MPLELKITEADVKKVLVEHRPAIMEASKLVTGDRMEYHPNCRQ